MLGPEQYAVYRTVIKHVLSDSERLPSLPTITLKVRKALSEPSTDAQSLALLIGKDPALSALLIKSASSPFYRRAVAPKTLTEVIALLGFANVNNMVMIHSMRNVFALRSAVMKTLFRHSWQRLVVKASLANFFARRLSFDSIDEAQMATFLTEVGSLAVLSALSETNQTPDPDTYFTLCRHYSKSLGVVVLNKWGVDKEFVNVLKQSGRWEQTSGENISVLDIVNLSIYYTALFTNRRADLPPLESLAAFAKLPEKHQKCARPNYLDLVTNNTDEIQNIVNTFK